MAVYTTQQNRHFFLAKTWKDDAVDEVTTAGDIALNAIGDNVCDKELYFVYKGADPDTVLRSDLIPVKNITYVKKVPAADMRIPFKQITVALSPDINGGNPIQGEDYVLRINFRQFHGTGDDSQYFKDACVHVTAAMVSDKTKFYAAMVKALNLSFSREIGATKTSNPYLKFTSDEDGIYILEKEQPWTLGLQGVERVLFEVMPTTIYDGGDEVIWAEQNETTGKFYTDDTPTDKSSLTVTGASATGVGNGKKIADLEYFCMGERGDQYHDVGWPNVIQTQRLVDPSKEYDVLEIHFAFTDDGVHSYRSEKDITVVAEKDTVISDIYDAFMEKAGLSTGASGGTSSSDKEASDADSDTEP